MALVLKNPPANAGNVGSVPGLENPLGKEGKDNLLLVLSWRIPWPEGPGGIQFMGSQRVRHN